MVVTRYTWDVCKYVTEPYLNVEHIFPTKQLAVQKLVEHAKKVPSVKKVIIFGSAIYPVCNSCSDVDALIFGDKEEWFNSRFKQEVSEYDILFDDILGKDQKFDLEVAKGVTVYERTDIE